MHSHMVLNAPFAEDVSMQGNSLHSLYFQFLFSKCIYILCLSDVAVLMDEPTD